ncbi:hypothetical protein Y032_0331g2736 [Ancylostoma ceylanicum]|uniref:Uncharacterized protein n=1 Tax=Ancylostoma ceylanicum TaxID=53326 RepID=A0A016RZK0_9BILA|nr:hypothetical protein Y032_0331g2736 [Ancylostoma ceylanicum]
MVGLRLQLRPQPYLPADRLVRLETVVKNLIGRNRANGTFGVVGMSVGNCADVQVRAHQEGFQRYYQDIKRYCERYKLAAQQKSDESPVGTTVEATIESEEPDTILTTSTHRNPACIRIHT